MTTSIQPSLGPVITPRTAIAKAKDQMRQMEAVRDRKMSRWRDLEAFITPYSSNVDGTARKYEDDALNILDETVQYARATLQSFLHSGMTNPSRVWEQWAVSDVTLQESASVKDWLHTANERHTTLKAQSNFYDAMAWVYGEWPTFGTAVVLVEEDEGDVFRYVPLGIGSYALADNAKGDPIALSRRLQMTVRQMIERFATNENGVVDVSIFSDRVKQAIERGSLEDEVEVCHLICPNDTYSPVKETPEHFAFASYYWEASGVQTDGSNGFLAKEGYREWPAMVFRWARMQGDPWGTDSPGLLTLAAVKSLQQMESDKLLAIEKVVKPPLVVPTELVSASLLPAAKNSVNTRTGQTIGALHDTHPTSIQIIGAEQQEVRERIMSLWWTRMILANSVDQRAGRKTAREVEEISQERLLVLGRMVESAGRTFTMGSDREFAIMARRGFLPPAPPELQGRALAVEYTSFLAIAQKSVGLTNIQNYGLWVAEMQKVIQDPAFQFKTDWAQLADEVGVRSGIPPRVQRTDDAVEEMLAAQAAAVQKREAAEQGALEAKAAKDLSQAPMGGDTALSRTLGGGA